MTTLELETKNPLDEQVGGDHYSKLAIQPAVYSERNNLSYLQGNAIKYITRYKDKGGVEDLYKAIHTVKLLIELEKEGLHRRGR